MKLQGYEKCNFNELILSRRNDGARVTSDLFNYCYEDNIRVNLSQYLDYSDFEI